MTSQKIKRYLKQVYVKLSTNRITRKFITLSAIAVAIMLIPFSKLFDKKWYQSQRVYVGDVRDKLPALLHYLMVGRKKGYTPNPLFIPAYIDPQGWRVARLDPLLKYILKPSLRGDATHPFFDGKSYSTHVSRFGPLAAFLSNANDTSPLPYDKAALLSGLKCVSWGDYRAEAHEYLKSWSYQENLKHQNRLAKSFNLKEERKFIKEFSSKPIVNSTSRPMVSIIMPAWNREKIIVSAIQSVQSQTFVDWELLVVDDGSTDSTTGLVKAIARSDKRVRLIAAEHGGVCRARNRGLREAVGDYIAFLDSDNTWTSNYLKVMIAGMATKNIEAAYAAVRMDKKGLVNYRVNTPNEELLRIGNYIDLNVLVVTKRCLDKVGYFDESLRRMVDYDIILKINKTTTLHYFPFVGVNYTHHDDVKRITNTELTSWNGVVKNRNLIDWHAQNINPTRKGSSVVVVIRDDLFATLRCLQGLLVNTSFEDFEEIVVVDISPQPSIGLTASALSRLHSKIIYYRSAESSDVSLASNVGFTYTTGENIIFIQEGCVVEPGWHNELINAVSGEALAAGPVQLTLHRQIFNCGVDFPFMDIKKATPVLLLNDHAVDDLRYLPDNYTVPALADGCIAINAKKFSGVEGFNPLFDNGLEVIDLSIRLQKSYAGNIVNTKKSLVINYKPGRGWSNQNLQIFEDQWSDVASYSILKSNLWKAAGFDLVGYQTMTGHKTVRPILKPASNEMRWAIKIPSPSDHTRFEWGDTHFAEALKKSIEKIKGNVVAIDFRGAHDRPTSYLDNVVLTIRGLVRVRPQPGKINILWVISHPEQVSEQELKEYDIVYSAGKAWSSHATNMSGRKVHTLLQCTDSSVFKPMKEKIQEFQNTILFVGNSRNVFRPVVRDALKENIEVKIIGNGWEQYIDKKYISGRFIPNNQLPGAYGSSTVVLNDHWHDMAKWGFISNRLFDVAATGSWAISDKVEGIDDVFEGLVKVYDSSEDLKNIINHVNDAFPDEKRSMEIANIIREKHSFDARAKRLVKDAEEIRR